jgi:hypothetical protein
MRKRRDWKEELRSRQPHDLEDPRILRANGLRPHLVLVRTYKVSRKTSPNPVVI